MDDNVPVIGDWLPPNPSPRTLFADFFAKEYGFRLASYDSLQKTNGGSLPEPNEPRVPMNCKKQDCESGIQASKELSIELNSSTVPKSSIRGGLSERIAGRAGFGHLTLDTSKVRTTTSFSSPKTNVCSPLLTIPPGFSPTMLLDSPVFTSNSLTEPSRARGAIAFTECDNAATALTNNNSTDHTAECVDPTFSFKLPRAYFSCSETKPSSIIHPSSPSSQEGIPILYDEIDSGNTLPKKGTLNSNFNTNHGPPNDSNGNVDLKGECNSASLSAPGDDGYNWRKYGQKHVKGSEYPRSYYKCTHPNCEAKKKVERSHEGLIAEIVYKGFHNHSQYLTNRRSTMMPNHPGNDLQLDGFDQNDLNQVDQNANKYASVAMEQCEQSNPVQFHDGMDAASLFSNEDEEDERITHGSLTLGCEGDGDETESKRRKLDACALEMSAASRAVREPRVVVQTTSEIDVLDDGYRWRKYGQKVVKGNPNPRSYYKCTNPGCTVRKHVERASHDLKSVITTYEGKHNHEVPEARTSCQASSSAVPSMTASASSSSSLQRKAEPMCEQQLGPAVPNFSLAMAQQGFNTSFAMAGLGRIPSLKMPILSPHPAYVSRQHLGGGVGFMMAKIVPKDELAKNANPPISGGSTVYRLPSRMPLGSQL